MHREWKEVNKKITKLRLMFLPGPVFLGLAIFGLFGPKGGKPDNFMAVFQNQKVAYVLFVVGVLMMAIEFSKLRPLLEEKNA